MSSIPQVVLHMILATVLAGALHPVRAEEARPTPEKLNERRLEQKQISPVSNPESFFALREMRAEELQSLDRMMVREGNARYIITLKHVGDPYNRDVMPEGAPPRGKYLGIVRGLAFAHPLLVAFQPENETDSVVPAYVWVKDEERDRLVFLNAWMLEQGLAFYDFHGREEKGPLAIEMQRAERDAQVRKRGIWKVLMDPALIDQEVQAMEELRRRQAEERAKQEQTDQ